MSVSPNATSESGDSAAEASSCPTPLGWQQVRSQFLQQAVRRDVPWRDATHPVFEIGVGDPVYFFNSAVGNLELYCLVAWLLREDYQCVLLDYPDDLHCVADCVDLVRQVHSTLRHDTATLIGSSFASLPALEAAIALADAVRAVALHAGFARRRLSLAERGLIALGRMSNRPLSGVPFWSTIHEQNDNRWFPPYDISRWSFCQENIGRTQASAAANRSALLRTFDVTSRCAKICQPVLVMSTEGDGRLAQQASTHLVEQLPNGRLEEVHTFGRLPFMTHPHRMAKLIRSFLEDPHGESTIAASCEPGSCSTSTPDGPIE